MIGLQYEDLFKENDRVIKELMKATNMLGSLSTNANQELGVASQAIQPFSQKELVNIRKCLEERDRNEELLRIEM